MLRFSTSKLFLCPTVAILCLLAGGNVANALGYYPRDTKDTLPPIKNPHPNVGGYVEAGGNLGFMDVLSVKTAGGHEFEKTTINSSNGGYNAGVGIRFYGVAIGVDASMFTLPINHQFLGYDFGGGLTQSEEDEETIGNVNMSVITAKLTTEYIFDGHNTLYAHFGAGTAMYDISDENNNTKYSDQYIKPALTVGAGYKLYTEQNKGLYLLIGAKYTAIINNNLKTHKTAGNLDLSGWLNITQLELKIGYQF